MRLGHLEAAVYLTWARLTLRRRAIEEIRNQWAGKPVGNSDSGTEREAGRARYVGQNVMTAAGKMPFPCTCLVQSVAAVAMLRRRGINADLRFGVKRRDDGFHGITAHAWVEYEGAVIVDSGSHDEYIPFAKP